MLSARLLHVSSLPAAAHSWGFPEDLCADLLLLFLCLAFVDFIAGASASLERVYDHPGITSARKSFFSLKECALKKTLTFQGRLKG